MFRDNGNMKPEQKSVRKVDYVLSVEDRLASEECEYLYGKDVFHKNLQRKEIILIS
jgi:hypothetical protein